MPELDPLCNCSSDAEWILSGHDGFKRFSASGLKGDGSVLDCASACGMVEFLSIPLTTVLVYLLALLLILVVSRWFCKKRVGVMLVILLLGGMLEIVIRVYVSTMQYYSSFKGSFNSVLLIPRALLFLAIVAFAMICWLFHSDSEGDSEGKKSQKKTGRPRKT